MALLLSCAGFSDPIAAQTSLREQFAAESIANRRENAQQQLDALGATPTEGNEAADVADTREVLTGILSALSSLDLSLKTRQQFDELTETIPARLKELEREARSIDGRRPPAPGQASQEMLDELVKERDEVQGTIDRLIQETNKGDVRIGLIARQRAELETEWEKLQRELREARELVRDGENAALGQLKVELAETRLAELNFKAEALEAERRWLLERTPLQDELLRVAKRQLDKIAQDLEIVATALGQDLEQRRQDLRSSKQEIERRLAAAEDPIEKAELELELEALDIRARTTRLGEERVRLADEIDRQEERSAEVKRNLERLASLVDRYVEGEGIAQRLQVLQTRLTDARDQADERSLVKIQGRLPRLNERLFQVDDALYEFDDEMAKRYAALESELGELSPEARAEAERRLRDAAAEKQAALRSEQEVLGHVVDDITTLQAILRAQRTLIDEANREALAKMLWIRNADSLGVRVFKRALAGAASLQGRLAEKISTELAAFRTASQGNGSSWIIALLLIVALPWAAAKAYRWFGHLAEISLAEQTQRGQAPGLNPALGILAQAAVWPLYIFVLVWFRKQSLGEPPSGLGAAILDAIRVSAVILGIYLFGRRLFRRNGWGQYFWELTPELCKLLRRSLALASAASFILLVPRQVLLAAPGGPGEASQSMALARLLFVAFQLIALFLVANLGRRNGPLMGKVLADSRDHDGFLWRIWPLVYAATVIGLIAILGLDLMGLRFAATLLWTQSFASIAVVLALRMVVAVYLLLLIQKLFGMLNTRAEELDGKDNSINASAGRALSIIRMSVNSIAMLLALGLVLEVWGLRVSQLLTSPTAFQIVARGLSALGVAGVAIVLVQLSRAIANNVLKPRTQGGVTLEAGRKLRTLAPLVQTTFNVVITFIAAAVILRVIGFDTGPVLAGVGIFGLAVGFAAQSLIKDLINGLFILFEDSLSIGDIVNLGGRGGQVERVTLRAVTIRDLQGNVHVIPNGTIDVVTNMTKDFSRYLLDVGVAYREDVDEVIAVLREIDEEMRGEPEYRYDMLEPIEVMGLDRFADSAVIVRARLKTRPIQQWRVGREFNRRIKQRFDERGIEIPFPHQTIYWGEPKQGPQAPVELRVESRKSEGST